MTTAKRRRRRAFGGLGLIALVLGSAFVFLAGNEVRTGAETEAGSSNWRAILDANLPPEPPPSPAGTVAEFTDLRGLADHSVPLTQLFDLQVRTIVLDPGHGGRDPGSSGRGGLAEKEITLDVAQRLARRLRANGYEVLLTRTGDTYLSLRERVMFANEKDTDLFVSIHVNNFPSDSVNAVETYYFGAGDRGRTLMAAEVENRGSDYSLADFNKMIARMGTTVKLQESRQLARAIQRSMIRNIRRMDVEVANWGVKSGPFVVLLGSEAPSILAEIGVLSHPEDEARLGTPLHREQLAMYLEEGILTYLISRAKSASENNPTDPYGN